MLQAQRHGLMSWMEEMDVFLHVEDPTKGDLPTLQAQLDESSVSYKCIFIRGIQFWGLTQKRTRKSNVDHLNILTPCNAYPIIWTSHQVGKEVMDDKYVYW